MRMKKQPHIVIGGSYLLRVAAVLAVLLGIQPVQSASTAQALSEDTLTPLETLLNLDGSLDLSTGFSGTLNPTGYRMAYGPDGAPIFESAGARTAPMVPADTWNPLGTGVTDDVHAVAVTGPDVYIGGSFTDAGGNPNADRIARWDGSAWHALGAGLNDTVWTIAVAGLNVYVGGDFTDAGGDPDADYIARWHTPSSSLGALGAGLNGPVLAIAVAGPNVYVGGRFTGVDGISSADHIVRWDGHYWHALGAGLNDDVQAIAAAGSDVYIGGRFADAGGHPNADRIVRWDGLNWYPLGAGLSGDVRAIAVAGTDVYVGGQFTDAGGIASADRIARWDGSSWHALDSGLSNSVNAIVVAGSSVYVGGSFTDAGGISSADHIARWDGLFWYALGTGLNDAVTDIAVAGADVYVGGLFTTTGGPSYPNYLAHAARWDTADLSPDWNALGAGLGDRVTAIAVAGPDVYVGGDFTDAGGVAGADHIARWDGSAWHALGTGLNGGVYAIAVAGRNVYVGGDFTRASRMTGFNRIARWDGSFWHALDSGLNDLVLAIAVAGPDVYVGGRFTDAGGIAGADHIARWDGSVWHALGSGLNDAVYVITVAGPDLYVGGDFTDADGNPDADYVVRWIDSTHWYPLSFIPAKALSDRVRAIAVVGSDVYVGGYFSDAGGDPNADCIARWDGLDWYPLGAGSGGAVWDIVVAGPDFYVGGGFIERIARWDGSAWHTLGAGPNGYVEAIAVAGPDVYVGGRFTDAGGDPDIDYIARWGSAYTATYSTIYLPLVARNQLVAPDLTVEQITASATLTQVVIRNKGNLPVGDEFWVDAYLDPTTPPTAVNQTWQHVGDHGIAWGVTADALPLDPGGAITLTATPAGGQYYHAGSSDVSWPLAAGTQVYAQVDSAHAQTSYGAVLEGHEIKGEAYNNITGPVTSADASNRGLGLQFIEPLQK